jgi:histone H3/H4
MARSKQLHPINQHNSTSRADLAKQYIIAAASKYGRTQALHKVKKASELGSFAMKKNEFARLVKEIVEENYGGEYRFQSVAIASLQTLGEAYLASLLGENTVRAIFD